LHNPSPHRHCTIAEREAPGFALTYCPDSQDRWQSARLGVAVVATDRVHAQRQLESVVHFIERQRPDCPLLTYEIEML